MSWSFDVDEITTSFVTGRIRSGSDREPALPALELWIDESFERANTPAKEDPEPIEFRIPLPPYCFDAQQHAIEIRFGDAISVQQFQSEYEGFIDPFSENLISGWATDLSRPKVPVEIEIDVNGLLAASTTAGLLRHDLNASVGFSHKVRETLEMDRSFILRARIAGTDIDLQGSPVLSISRPRLVKAAQQLNTAFHYLEQRLVWTGRHPGPALNLSLEERHNFANLLLEGSSVADVLELRRRFLQPMQRQLTEHYARRDYATLGSHYPQSVPRRSRDAHRDRPVDVIVPVFAGVEETERCLKSVLTAAAGCRYRLIVVLDNPEASEMRHSVHAFAKSHEQVLLIENETNVGFAESVNRAMIVHRDRDVVILQADCEVHGDWLLRLQNAAYEGVGAGIVNPLTNSGEFLSYPAWGVDLPEDAPFDRLDALAKRHNAGRTVSIPAAMGFCLYIRRGCLDDLGFFHNDRASGGYYAEKYFSVNAAAQGWRTLLAGDVFVQHRGYVSFVTRDSAALENARDDFERWCPFYADSVTDFLVDDPSLPFKRELDLERLASLDREVFCFITHSGGGGTERHLRDLSESLAIDRIGAIVLFALPGRRVAIGTAALDHVENLRYNLDREFDKLVQDLKRLRVHHVHIHSNVDVPQELFNLPEKLGVRYDVTVHDYAWVCPRITLTNHSGDYCGEPPIHVCETCAGGGVADLLETSLRQLSGARRVFCPSQDTLDRIRKHLPLGNLLVRHHPEWIETQDYGNRAATEEAPVRVAIIGRLSGHKGLRVLRQCAAHALEWNLPLQFVVIGSTTHDSEFTRLTNVEITGPYDDLEVDDLIEQHKLHVAFLPSVWPETYSYTLSVAFRCGLIPVAFDLGAIAERLRLAQSGILLPLGTDASKINEALLSAERKPPKAGEARGAGYLNMLRDYYGFALRDSE